MTGYIKDTIGTCLNYYIAYQQEPEISNKFLIKDLESIGRQYKENLRSSKTIEALNGQGIDKNQIKPRIEGKRIRVERGSGITAYFLEYLCIDRQATRVYKVINKSLDDLLESLSSSDPKTLSLFRKVNSNDLMNAYRLFKASLDESSESETGALKQLEETITKVCIAVRDINLLEGGLSLINDDLPEPFRSIPKSRLGRPLAIIDPKKLLSQLGFRLKSEVGRGEFGRILCCTNSNGEDVIVKCIDYCTGNIKDQGEILSGWLKHPNICVSNGFFLRNKRDYSICLSFSEDTLPKDRANWQVLGTITEDIPHNSGLTQKVHKSLVHYGPKTAVHIGEQICSALSYLHENHIYHLDLKPENILFDHIEGRAMITDFGGSARALDGEALVKTWTPLYCPPEKAENEIKIMQNKLDPENEGLYDGSKFDAWSLGIVILQCLTGLVHTDIYLKKRLDPVLDEMQATYVQTIYFARLSDNEKERVLHKFLSLRNPKFYDSKDNRLRMISLVTLIVKLLRNNPEKRLSPSEALQSLDKLKEDFLPNN